MKILFLGDARSPHLKRWLSSFNKRGHEVHLGTVYPESARKMESGISIHDISGKGKIRKLNVFWMFRNTMATIRSIRPHLLHAHYVNSYGWVGALTNFHPFILTVWGGDVLPEQDAFKKFKNKQLTKWALRKADAITADAPNLIDACVSLGKKRSSIREVTFGIQVDSFIQNPNTPLIKKKFGISSDAFVIFSPRRVDPLMNIDTIIKCIPKVVQKLPKAVFLVKIFPGQIDEVYLSHIQRLSENLGVAEHVRYCNDPSDELMRDCYHIADVAVSIPSSDGMPATIFEAMASLTPLVVSDLPAYDGVVVEGESGIRVPLRDENRLAEAIVDLLTDEAKRKHFRERGLQIVKEKGDIEKEIEKVENLYRELIQEKWGGVFG